MSTTRTLFGNCLAAALLTTSLAAMAAAADDTAVGDRTVAAARPSLVLVVMDPLAAPLACDCVKGYAQRKYEHLGAYLQEKLHCDVKVVWSESLEKGMEDADGHADIIIGKHSVVRADAREVDIRVRPVAQLTGLDDSVTQSGLFVVRRDDPAKTVADLAGYRIFFGPEDCAEKHAAPIALLKKSGVSVPDPIETSPACSSAATALLELPADVKAAAVISSYAQPLLEGCGTIRKGDLRVIGESRQVPFITAFLNRELSDEQSDAITTALLDVELNAELLVQLETASGFRTWEPTTRSAQDQPVQQVSGTKKKD